MLPDRRTTVYLIVVVVYGRCGALCAATINKEIVLQDIALMKQAGKVTEVFMEDMTKSRYCMRC